MLVEWLELIWLAGLTGALGALAMIVRRRPTIAPTVEIQHGVWPLGEPSRAASEPAACELPQVHECHTSVTHPRLRRIRGRR